MSHNIRIVRTLLELGAGVVAVRAAKAHARARGRYRAIAGGWDAYAARSERSIRDWLTKELTAFRDFAALVNARGDYRPSLRIDRDWRALALANAYDAHQQRVGDARRAERFFPS